MYRLASDRPLCHCRLNWSLNWLAALHTYSQIGPIGPFLLLAPVSRRSGTTTGRFMYVGMSGRSITAETTARGTRMGLYIRLHIRLQSHASGRRSGDQFCVYVADRLALPHLSPENIADI